MRLNLVFGKLLDTVYATFDCYGRSRPIVVGNMQNLLRKHKVIYHSVVLQRWFDFDDQPHHGQNYGWPEFLL